MKLPHDSEPTLSSFGALWKHHCALKIQKGRNHKLTRSFRRASWRAFYILQSAAAWIFHPTGLWARIIRISVHVCILNDKLGVDNAERGLSFFVLTLRWNSVMHFGSAKLFIYIYIQIPFSYRTEQQCWRNNDNKLVCSTNKEEQILPPVINRLLGLVLGLLTTVTTTGDGSSGWLIDTTF